MFKSVQSRGSESGAAVVDIAPLIDIVFILLIFFLVTATFVKDTGVDVTRPQATLSRALESNSMRISVTAEGNIYTDGNRVTLEQLGAKVSGYVSRNHDGSVVVIPDGELPSKRLIEVMDVARSAGAQDVAVATEQKGAGS